MRMRLLPTSPAFLPMAALLLLVTVASCDQTGDPGHPDALVIGANMELTGPLPEVGQSSVRGAELFVETVNAAGGVPIGTTSYMLTLEVRDNENDAAEAAAVATAFVGQGVHVLLGPNRSVLAVPAGGQAEAAQTPMVSPWSTNPATTLGRSWVFRAAFVDTFQGPVLAEFATSWGNVRDACVLAAADDDYSSGLAETFISGWEALHGAGTVAFESFTADTEDLEPAIRRLRDTGCDLIFLPLFTEDILRALLVLEELDMDVPVLGSDSWAAAGLLEACGQRCVGTYVTTHFVATGATGPAGDFVQRYRNRYGEDPDDIAALTWDALAAIAQGAENCGTLTGNVSTDRACLRDGIAAIDGLPGVTGTIAYPDSGDPEKCVLIAQITPAGFEAVDEICP